jgi:hypothetical protein
MTNMPPQTRSGKAMIVKRANSSSGLIIPPPVFSVLGVAE